MQNDQGLPTGLSNPSAGGPAASPLPTPIKDGILGRLRKHPFLAQLLQRGKWKVVLGILLLAWFGLKAVILPAIASQAVSVFAEGYGIDMEVGDWGAGLLDFNATAKDVVVRVAGPFAKKELLEIDEMELDLSVWRKLRGRGWINEVRLKGPKLYLERHVNGSWNWQELGDLEDVLASFGASQGDGAGQVQQDLVFASTGPQLTVEIDPAFELNRLRIEDMRLEWVEQLPGNSGGGLIHEQKATMFLDDVVVSAQDVMGLQDVRSRPTNVSFAARTSDGKISAAGVANFFGWSQVAMARDGRVGGNMAFTWAPSFMLELQLENVGAGAFARLTPEAALRPNRGSMEGTVRLALDRFQFDCQASLALRDVTFEVNRSSPLLARRGERVERSVETLRPISGQRVFPCGGLGTDPGFRAVHAFQSEVTRQALQEAPLLVRAVAAADHTRYSAQPLEPEYRPAVADLTQGVDPRVLSWYEFGKKVARERQGISERLPFLRRP